MTAAMVFAAGLGTRMRPLTEDRPKALVEVAGRPLIDHALDQVAGAGPLVVNTHHFAPLLEAHLQGRGLTLLREEPELLETGGGLKNALPHLGPDPVLTTNSDSVWTGPPIRRTLTDAWDGARMDGLLLLVPEARAIGRGGRRFRLDGEGRMRFDATGLIATGAAITRTDTVAADPRSTFSLLDPWLAMMEEGRLFGVEHPGHWADVGTPDRIAPAEAMLRDHA